MMDSVDMVEARYGGLVTAESLKAKQFQPVRMPFATIISNHIDSFRLKGNVNLYSYPSHRQESLLLFFYAVAREGWFALMGRVLVRSGV